MRVDGAVVPAISTTTWQEEHGAEVKRFGHIHTYAYSHGSMPR